MRIDRLLVLFITAISSFSTHGQTKDEFALKGITLIDMGKYEEGIKELRKARNLDPSDYELTLELGRAFLLLEKPRKAQEYLNLLLTHPERREDLFILLSRSAPTSGKESPLNQGMVEFPKSGPLFAEMGRVLATKNQLDRAIAYWEKGIEVDPSFADNYLFASKVYLINDDFLWGWLYGETYLNLKLDNHPDPELIKDVRNAFRRSITLAAVSKPEDELGRLVHSIAGSCAAEEKPRMLADLAERLDCIATKWLIEDRSPFRIPLFGLYHSLQSQGQLEAYLFWVYGSADQTELSNWLETNSAAFQNLNHWMFWNGLILNEENRFTKLK